MSWGLSRQHGKRKLWSSRKVCRNGALDVINREAFRRRAFQTLDSRGRSWWNEPKRSRREGVFYLNLVVGSSFHGACYLVGNSPLVQRIGLQLYLFVDCGRGLRGRRMLRWEGHHAWKAGDWDHFVGTLS